jgi:hypothetical protein
MRSAGAKPAVFLGRKLDVTLGHHRQCCPQGGVVGMSSVFHPGCLQILVLCLELPAKERSTLLGVNFATQHRLIVDMLG